MKMKILAGLVAAVVVAAAVVGGVALAQGGGDDNDGKGAGGATLYERAAAILGVDAGDLEDALRQAKHEMTTEKMESHLAALVEKGIIDEDEAEEYREWFSERPRDMPAKMGRHRFGGWKHGFGKKDFPKAGWKQ